MLLNLIPELATLSNPTRVSGIPDFGALAKDYNSTSSRRPEAGIQRLTRETINVISAITLSRSGDVCNALPNILDAPDLGLTLIVD